MDKKCIKNAYNMKNIITIYCEKSDANARKYIITMAIKVLVFSFIDLRTINVNTPTIAEENINTLIIETSS